MDNPGEIMRLCRLCLVKDQVNIPIFDEQGDIRQIFLKISSCLPVKVSKEDQLPKSICDGCSNKLDLLYEFRNSSVNAEKALLSWVSQAIKDVDETVGVATQPVAKPSETQVKEETLEECHAPLVHSNDSMDAQESAAFDENSAKEESDEPPPPKRARRTAAVKAQINIAPDSDDEDDDDLDIDAEPLTKIEDESDESDGDEKDDPSYPDVPGTSADDQPGPSGVGKDGVEAPTNFLSAILKQGSEEILIHLVEDENDLTVKSDSDMDEGQKVLHLIDGDTLDKENISDSEDTEKSKCNVCGRLFKYLSRHLQTHGPYNCQECLTNFKTKEEYDEHVALHVTEPPKQNFSCEVCKLNFITATDISLHNFQHTKKYTCPLCDFTTKNKSKSTMINHIKRHEGKFAVKCDICGQGFINQHFLKPHREIHEGIAKYECEFCQKKFTVKRYLDVHRSLNHKKELYGVEEVFQCEVCGRNFSFEKSLRRHLSCIHKIGEDRTVECPVCSKVIANNHNLKKHMRVHTGEKRFCCDICGKAFAEKKYLKGHQIAHKKERARKRRAEHDSEYPFIDCEEDDIQYISINNDETSDHDESPETYFITNTVYFT